MGGISAAIDHRGRLVASPRAGYTALVAARFLRSLDCAREQSAHGDARRTIDNMHEFKCMARLVPPEPNGWRCARRRAMAAGFGLELLSATAFAAHAHRHQRRKTQSAPDAVNSRCRPLHACHQRRLFGTQFRECKHLKTRRAGVVNAWALPTR